MTEPTRYTSRTISTAILVVGLCLTSMSLADSVATQTELAKLLPINGGERETFGTAVAIEGDTIVIGADGTGWSITVSGSAYVLTRDANGGWTQQVKLAASATPVHDRFGASVAISGDTILVGAIFEPDGLARGAAYIYGRSEIGSWSQRAHLTASDPADGARFGRAVALDGDTAAIYGAADDGSGGRIGAVYVFERSGASETWTERQTLLTDDGVPIGSTTSATIAIHGDTIIAGAPLDEVNGPRSGSVYIFRRDAQGNWSQETKLIPSDGAESNQFGNSVALVGDTIVIGAPDFKYPEPLTGGKAYTFTRNETGGWTEHVLPAPAGNEVGDHFGLSVAFDGETIVVGQASSGFTGEGRVYHRDATGAWFERTQLRHTEEDANGLGFSVAVDGATALLGAQFDDSVARFAGAAYVFAVPGCHGDLDGDNEVALSDLATLLTNFGTPSGAGLQDGDLDGDGDVDLSDLAELLGLFGTICA